MIHGVLAFTALAQSAPTNAAAITSVWDYAVKGGVVMIPIALCSLIAVALFAERLISLQRRKVMPPAFMDGLRQVLSGGDVRKAIDFCRSLPSPIARIAEAGLRRWNSPIEYVEKHIAEAGQREAILLRKYLRGLSVIAAVSPLLGLLGTIFGMIKAFQTVAAAGEALGRTELLAEGIYEAMITTAAGLIVAIPTLLAHHFLASRVDGMVLDMDRACIDLVENRGAGERPVITPEEVVPDAIGVEPAAEPVLA